jgi:hypothetical protein
LGSLLWVVYGKITEVAQIIGLLFFLFPKNGLGYTLGDFSPTHLVVLKRVQAKQSKAGQRQVDCKKREMQIKQEKTISFERKTVRARRKLRVLRVVQPGANPAITSGNASVVKIYKKTNSLERL